MNAKTLVLEKLKQAKSRGITSLDFGNNFALRSRISELKKSHDIQDFWIEDFSNGYKRRIKRYVLK